MNVRARTGWLLAPLVLLPWSPEARAAPRFDIGLRANALYAPGSRIEARHGIGLTSSLDLGDGWFVTAALDRYDYEIRSDLTIVSVPTARSHVLGIAAGRRHSLRESALTWFWNAGIAVGITTTSDGSAIDATGDAVPFSIAQGTEIHLTAALGTIWHVARHWSVTAAFRAENHYIDLRIPDPDGGRPLRETSETPVGAFVSLNYQFGEP